MSEEQLKALLKKVKGDTSLQEKLKGAASPDAAVEIAKDAGFAITAITTFFFAITIIGPHTTAQAQTQRATEAGAIEREREERGVRAVECISRRGGRVRMTVTCPDLEGDCRDFELRDLMVYDSRGFYYSLCR